MSLEDLAHSVVVIVKGALAPVLERVAAAEARLTGLHDIRDRVVVLETKQSAPLISDPALEELRGRIQWLDGVSLAAVLGRVTALEERAAAAPVVTWTGTTTGTTGNTSGTTGNTSGTTSTFVMPESEIPALVKRLTVVEGVIERGGVPSLELHDLNVRLTACESVIKSLGATKHAEAAEVAKDLGAVRERLVALEVRAPIVGPTGPAGQPGKDGINGRDGANGTDTSAELTKEIGTLRERVIVLETRAPLPGPAGAPGADGLGFEDLGVEFDGDRTLALKFVRGAQMKTFPVLLPFLRYQGVYNQGKPYEVGDCVTWAGQLWHCNEATISPPGDGSKLWQLCVRKGRDGKDGKDAPPLPIVMARR